MRILHLLAVVMLGAAFVLPASATSERYEASLDRYVDLLYIHYLGPQQIDALVEGFRTSMLEREDAKSCPALRQAMNEFVDNDFRKTISGYMSSPELRGDLEKALRTHMTQEDLDAYVAFAEKAFRADPAQEDHETYLAFVESVADKRFVERQAAASADMQRLLELHMESQAIKEMMTGMTTKLMQVKMTCSK